MLPWMVILALTASLPTPVMPASQPTALSASQPTVPATTDCGLRCFERRWVVSDLRLAISTNDLAAATRQIASLGADLTSTHVLLGAALDALQKAATTSDGLAGQVGIPWFWHPALWSAIGGVFVAGIIVACLEGLKAIR